MDQSRVMHTLDGTPFMDPWDLLDAYIDRYELHGAIEDDPLAVVREWSNFVDGERLTGSLFAGAETVREGRTA